MGRHDVVEISSFHSVNVIPEHIFRYLTRKGIGADYLISDLVLEDRLSVEEIATVLYLNACAFEETIKNTIRLGHIGLGTGCIESEIRARKLGDKHALNAKIDAAINLSYGQGVKTEVDRLLNAVCNETSPSYEFVTMGPKIWLIVKAGFLAMLKDPTKRLDFYRDYLKAVGQIAPFSSVARTDVFSQYVEEMLS